MSPCDASLESFVASRTTRANGVSAAPLAASFFEASAPAPPGSSSWFSALPLPLPFPAVAAAAEDEEESPLVAASCWRSWTIKGERCPMLQRCPTDCSVFPSLATRSDSCDVAYARFCERVRVSRCLGGGAVRTTRAAHRDERALAECHDPVLVPQQVEQARVVRTLEVRHLERVIGARVHAKVLDLVLRDRLVLGRARVQWRVPLAERERKGLSVRTGRSGASWGT